jgi:hypothetical protein
MIDRPTFVLTLRPEKGVDAIRALRAAHSLMKLIYRHSLLGRPPYYPGFLSDHQFETSKEDSCQGKAKHPYLIRQTEMAKRVEMLLAMDHELQGKP